MKKFLTVFSTACSIFVMPIVFAQNERDEGYRQLFELNEREQAGLKEVIKPLSEETLSLDAELKHLELQMDRHQKVRSAIARKKTELEQWDEKLQIQERFLKLDIKDVLKKMETFMGMFFRVKRQMVMEDGKLNLLQLFSQASSPTDVMFQDFLLTNIQDQLFEQLKTVGKKLEQYRAVRNRLSEISVQISLYDARLQQSEKVLSEQRSFQSELLKEKRNEIQFFQKAMDEAIEEQRIIQERIQTVAMENSFESEENEDFIWPVEPRLGISAGFLDSEYEARFNLPHYGIDIPTDQLTPVRATMSGIVVTAHDGGENGYSYLQLSHSDEYSSVYGHLYEFLVKEGEQVSQNQIIAFSGGALGTKGAGPLSTGPHVHFEVLKNGKQIDPKRVLNL